MSERTPLIAGNWKMHFDHLEAIALVQDLAHRLEPDDYERAEVAVVPPFTSLRSVQTVLDVDKLPMALGAQTCHWETQGAFTGEISVPMLSKMGVRYVLCGHSERRALFGEDDATVNRKVRAVLDGGLVPILCVGETLEQREADEAEQVVGEQLRAGLTGVQEPGGIVIAYEPVWAIGSGRTATADQIAEVHGFLRARLAEGLADGDRVRLLYGGSVKAANAAEILAVPDVDGALVGGASLEANEFWSIFTAAARRAA